MFWSSSGGTEELANTFISETLTTMAVKRHTSKPYECGSLFHNTQQLQM
jgi:hypothetical protein